MMPVPILHIIGPAQLEGTSMVRIVGPLVKWLDPHRYSQQVWFLGNDGPLSAELQAVGAKVRVIQWVGVRWAAFRRDPAGAWRLWSALQRGEFAIIHQHFGGRPVRWLARAKSGAKIIFQIHCSTYEQKGFKVPQSSWGVDAVIAVSRGLAQEISGGPVHVVYPGVAIPETSGGQERHDGFPNDRIVGTACRLIPIKGLDHLIQAIATLRPELPDLRLEIAGTGPEQMRLETLVRTLGLTECVTFLGWQVDLAAAMARWAVFALPSFDEGLPIVVLEAMAASLPVVATAVGGVPEVVEDGRTGWLVPSGDSASLAEGLRLLLLNPEQRRAMGAAGRARAQEHFSIDRMVAGIAKIYDDILGQ